MARRVVIRSRVLNTAVAQLEELVKKDYKEIWKYHLEDLEKLADEIVEEAITLVPVDTGKLRDSIQARVSKSPRWPGIIVSASAKYRGFDYALIQEENEDFSHEVGQAHYLSEAFFVSIDNWYYNYSGRVLDVPETNYHPYTKGEKV